MLCDNKFISYVKSMLVTKAVNRWHENEYFKKYIWFNSSTTLSLLSRYYNKLNIC